MCVQDSKLSSRLQRKINRHSQSSLVVFAAKAPWLPKFQVFVHPFIYFTNLTITPYDCSLSIFPNPRESFTMLQPQEMSSFAIFSSMRHDDWVRNLLSAPAFQQDLTIRDETRSRLDGTMPGSQPKYDWTNPSPVIVSFHQTSTGGSCSDSSVLRCASISLHERTTRDGSSQ